MHIVNNISLDERELEFQFVRASGPGGQNVNKVSSAVQLRFDVNASPSLPPAVKQRLIRIAGKRVSQQGILIIDARRFRTQERNRQDAVERLVELIVKAAHQPKKRIKTKPSKAAREKRLKEKQRRGDIKRGRRAISGSD